MAERLTLGPCRQQVYFQMLPFLTILTLAEVQAIVRNAEQLLGLHERIAERIDQVEHELSWRRDDALRAEGGPQQARKTRMAAARIVGVLVEQVRSLSSMAVIVYLLITISSPAAELCPVRRLLLSSRRSDGHCADRRCPAGMGGIRETVWLSDRP